MKCRVKWSDKKTDQNYDERIDEQWGKNKWQKYINKAGSTTGEDDGEQVEFTHTDKDEYGKKKKKSGGQMVG